MHLRPLLIDSNTKQNIANLIAYAEDNPLTEDDYNLIVNGIKPAAGDTGDFTCEIPYGYRCVFTYEQQPVGKCRHLSVSVNETGKAPSVEAVSELMILFGFSSPPPIDNGKAWVEELGDGRIAINVLELV